MKHKKHHGKASKSVHHGMHGDGHGSNLKLKSPSQAIHVAPQKDKMAGNVGGSAHMAPSEKSLGHQDLIESGSGKLGHKREKY